MSYMLAHLHNGWQVDQAILSEEDRVVVSIDIFSALHFSYLFKNVNIGARVKVIFDIHVRLTLTRS